MGSSRNFLGAGENRTYLPEGECRRRFLIMLRLLHYEKVLRDAQVKIALQHLVRYPWAA